MPEPIEYNKSFRAQTTQRKSTYEAPDVTLPRHEDKPPEREHFFKATPKDIGNALLKSVVDPILRSFIDTGVTTIKDLLIWGGKKTTSAIQQNIPYAKESVKRLSDERGYIRSYNGKLTHNLREIYVETEENARFVLDNLYEYARQFDCVSFRYFLDLAGYSSDYTDEKWGWPKNMLARLDAHEEAPGKWVFDLPQPVSI